MSAGRKGRLLAGALLALACGACQPRPPAPSPAPSRAVLLVGVDAGDWLAIDALVAQGRLPHLARLRSRGRAAVLVSTPPLVSPLLWTTIATGRQPEDHGVLDFMRDLPGGGQAPVSARERRVAALWDHFSAAGRGVAVVGWWATHPAEPVRGTLVSDQLAAQLLRATARVPGTVWPAEAWPRLSDVATRPEDVPRAELERFAPVDEARLAALRESLRRPAGGLYQDHLAHLAAVVAGTRTHAALAERLLAAPQADLTAVYVEAVDTVSHLFVRESWGAQAIAAAYEDVDALVGRLAARARPETLVVVCSDHGFFPADAGVREDPSQLAGPATAWHRPYGIAAAIEARALLAGDPPPGPPPAVETLPRMTPLDLAPTVLHAAGLPVGREMPGRVALELLPAEVAARTEQRAASPPRPTPPAEDAAAGPDPEAVARLQALGYLGAAPTSLARQNLGESFFRRGRFEAAARELEAVVGTQPQNLAAWLWLAQALVAQGRRSEALRAYGAALALPGGREQALGVAVDLALALGERERARRWAAPGGGPADAVARAAVLRAEGRAEAAERELRAALKGDPARFEALSALFELLLAAHRAPAFLPLAERAAGLAPRDPRVVALLGEARLAVGDAARAETELARALGLAPDGDTLRLELARAQLQGQRPRPALETLRGAADSPEREALQGAASALLADWPRAAEHYQRALQARPDDVDLLNGLGWALRQQGRGGEARAAFERSLRLRPAQPEIRGLVGAP